MRIKEVEQATGLTAKAIRLYESKGLLTVSRESENDYRDYSEKDVKRLKTIAVLRRLDIPLKDIKSWCDGKVTLPDLIAQASYQAQTAEENAKAKASLTQELVKLLEEDPDADIPSAIEDTETLQELYKQLDDLTEEMRGNIFWPIYWSIIALGPVGWTFLRIIDGETEEAVWTLVVSLLIIPFVCHSWYRYFRVEKRKRNASGCLSALVFGICGIVLVFGSVILVSVIQDLFLAPGSGMYNFRHFWTFAAMIFPVVELFLAINVEHEAEPKKKEKLGLRGWLILIGLNLVVYYCCITGVTYYTEGAFVRHSALCPTGHTYTVSDIVQVEAGFWSKDLSWLPWHETGDFYYEITFADGTKEEWSELSDVDADEDSWRLLLQLDAELMDAGVHKVSSWENREYFPYDQECLDICDTILNNQ